MKLTDQEWVKYLAFAEKKAKTFGAQGDMKKDMASWAIEKLVKQKTKPDNIEAWLTTVVRNQMSDLGKKRGKDGKSRHSLKANLTSIFGKAIGLKNKRKDKYNDTTARDILRQVSAIIDKSQESKIVNRLENQERVRKLLAKLAKKDQNLLIAHFFEDKSNKQIAQEMGYKTDKVVATRIKQLLKKLKD